MELWIHDEGDIWGKQPLPETFPLSDGQGLISYLGEKIRSSTRDCYIVFSPAEEQAIVAQFRPFADCHSAFDILSWVGHSLTHGQKVVGFVPVYIDFPHLIRQKCEMRSAMHIRIHADRPTPP